jgi:hypothetical protein
MFAFMAGQLLKHLSFGAFGKRLSLGSALLMLATLPLAFPGLVSSDPVLLWVYRIGGAGVAVYGLLRVSEWVRERRATTPVPPI